MHVVKASIRKAVFDTVPDALSTTMEQIILQEPLFLLMGELFWEPVPDLRQESLNLGSKGRDGLFLILICAVKIPHQQIKGFNITIYYGKLFNYHVQWDIGSILQTVSTAAPLRECCIPSLRAESLYIF